MATKLNLFWSFLRNLGVRLGSVLVFFVLARILPPEQLGWFAVALVVVNFAELFADSGLGDAIAQKKKLNDKILNTALVLNTLIGFTAFVILLFLSNYIAQAIGAPESADLLAYISIGIFINSIGFAAQAYYRHNMDFKWLAVRALISMSLGAVVGISAALNGFGVYSFVLQFLTTSVSNTVLVWIKLPWKPKFYFNQISALSLFGYGKNVLMMKVLDFVATRSIELFVVFFYGPATLAIFIMGQKIYSVAMQLLSAVTLDVMLPTLSKQQANLELLKATYKTAFKNSLLLVSPLFVLLAMSSEYLIPFIFGVNGYGAENILFLFALLGAIQLPSFLNSATLSAIGLPKIPMYITTIKAIFSLLIMFTMQEASLPMFLVVFVSLSASTSIISFYFVIIKIGVELRFYIEVFTKFITSCLLLLLSYILIEWLSIEGELFNLLLLGVIGLCIQIVCLKVLEPNLLKKLIKDKKLS